MYFVQRLGNMIVNYDYIYLVAPKFSGLTVHWSDTATAHDFISAILHMYSQNLGFNPVS